MIELNGLQINVLVALVATIVSFILGMAWYAKFFAKPWAKEMGYDLNMRPSGKMMVRNIALSVIGNFLFA